MKTITQVYTVNAQIKKVWKALIDPKEIDGWGGEPVKMDDKVGTKFTLWGGDIHGINTEVIENKKLVQDWYEKDWKKPSKVTFKLSTKGNITTIELLHEDVPDKNADDIDDGWKRYYLGPLKDYLEK